MAVTQVGNPYVESSDLVANYPGASEALAERIDIVGVNPFADSAARATAIPSPVEGQMASLNNDDKVYRYSGSDWVAVGVEPGLTLVAFNSFTTESTVVINDCFTSTFDNYYFSLSGLVCSGSPQVAIRMRVSSTDASGSNYSRAYLVGGGATASSGRDSSQTSSIIFPDASVARSDGFATIYSPNLAEPTALFSQFNRSGGNSIYMIAAYHNLSTAYDGFSLIPSTGTITGTIRIYGYKNS